MDLHNPQSTDEELVTLAQNGDRTAFELLIKRYQNKILSLCSRLIGKSDEAKELTADVFAEAYQSLTHFRHEAKFSTWLYRIAANKSFSRLRQFARDRRFLVRDETSEDDENEVGSKHVTLQSTLPNPVRNLELEETKSKIRLVLSKMAKDQAQILLLHDLEELTYEEVSEVLDCPMGTVMSRLSRARQAFRNKWNKLD